MSLKNLASSVFGPARTPALSVTLARLQALAPGARADIVSAVALGFDRLAAGNGTATRLRICHFLAQAAHESDGFRTLEEYGGGAYFLPYEGRADLGNTQPGDGLRYHGRGIFQLTGRANYRKFGRIVGIDLESDPERAKDPAVSLAVAFAYWKERKIDPAADADDVVAVTRLINGGRNGLAERTRYLDKAKAIWTA